jgi:hypothetical protein
LGIEPPFALIVPRPDSMKSKIKGERRRIALDFVRIAWRWWGTEGAGTD